MGISVPDHLFHSLVHMHKRLQEICIRYRDPVCLEPLVDAHKMRGSKQSCPASGLPENGFQERTHAPLPIGPGNVNYSKAALRM